MRRFNLGLALLTLLLLGAWASLPAPGSTAVTAADTVKVFPSAYGPGAITWDHPSKSVRDSVAAGAWSLNVWQVTSTADDGSAGTFRAIVDSVEANQPEAHVIVFRTGGRIDLASDLFPGSNFKHVMVLGQSAPGEGITFQGHRFNLSGGTDVVLRGVRVQGMSDALTFTNMRRVMVDHVSSRTNGGAGGQTNFGFVGDSTVSSCQNGPVPCFRDATVQWSMFYWPGDVDIGSGRNVLMDGIPSGDALDVLSNYVMRTSLFAGCGIRHPEFSGDSVGLYDIVSANGLDRHIRNENASKFDIREAYIREGPCTSRAQDIQYGENTQTPNDAMYLEAIRSDNTGFDRTVSGAALFTGTDQTLFCRDRGTTPDICADSDPVPDSLRRSTPMTLAFMPTIQPMTDTYRDVVLDSSGAKWRISDDGQSKVDIRDVWDDSVVAQTKGDRGSATVLDRDTMTFITPASGTACNDADSDGLCDAFEKLETGSSTDSTSAAPEDDDDGDGYFNIEEANDPDLDPTVDESGGTPLTCTFDGGPGSCRQVLIVDATADTFISSTDAGGRDTTVFRSLDRPNIPVNVQTCPVYKPDNDSAAVVMDSVASSGVDDSTTVDGTLTAWAVPESVAVIRGWAEDANGVVCGGS